MISESARIDCVQGHPRVPLLVFPLLDEHNVRQKSLSPTQAIVNQQPDGPYQAAFLRWKGERTMKRELQRDVLAKGSKMSRRWGVWAWDLRAWNRTVLATIKYSGQRHPPEWMTQRKSKVNFCTDCDPIPRILKALSDFECKVWPRLTCVEIGSYDFWGRPTIKDNFTQITTDFGDSEGGDLQEGTQHLQQHPRSRKSDPSCFLDK